jgi:hypothetical protein
MNVQVLQKEKRGFIFSHVSTVQHCTCQKHWHLWRSLSDEHVFNLGVCNFNNPLQMIKVWTWAVTYQGQINRSSGLVCSKSNDMRTYSKKKEKFALYLLSLGVVHSSHFCIVGIFCINIWLIHSSSWTNFASSVWAERWTKSCNLTFTWEKHLFW